MLFLSSPGPIGSGLWAWFALIPLLVVCQKVTPRQAAIFGLFCGLLYHTLLLYWIVIVLGTYGHLAWWISFPALLLLSLYMSLYTAVFGAICCKFFKVVPLILLAPVTWVALDYIRSILFTGFPWQDLGYSQYLFPLVNQHVDLFGHHGVTFLIVMVNSMFAALLVIYSRKRFNNRPKVITSVLPVCLIILLISSYNIYRYQQIEQIAAQSSTMVVTVVQGNISQDKKWLPQFQQQTVEIYIALSKQAIKEQPASLLVWPETALPFYPLTHPLFAEIIERLVKPHQVGLLVGAPYRTESADSQIHYFNKAFLLSAAGLVVGSYSKQHLVPFGEYIPFRRFLTFATPLVETMGDFTAGSSAKPLVYNNKQLGVIICFESIFPDLARKQVAYGAAMLVNITNDAWFGRSSAPLQHLSKSVLRATENRRSLARSANTGISGFIDPLGQIIKSSALFEPAFVTAEIPLLTEETFFVRYGHHFDLLCLLALLLIFIFGRGKSKPHTSTT